VLDQLGRLVHSARTGKFMKAMEYVQSGLFAPGS
jgi:hypothetical protein